MAEMSLQIGGGCALGQGKSRCFCGW